MPNQSYILLFLASVSIIYALVPSDVTPKTTSPVLYHNASHYCSQFDQCESCLKDHSQITNATKCSYKICVQPANDKLKSFPVCFPSDEDVPCPGNMQYMKKLDGIEGCSTIQQTSQSGKTDGAPTPAPTPVTPANNTTIPSNTTTTASVVPTNVTTPATPVNPNTTTISPPTNGTTVPPNTTTSVKPTSPFTTISTSGPTKITNSTGSPITLSTTTTPPIIPVPASTSRFSPSSFVGGMCLMAGIATLLYFGIKYYRSNVSRYRQF